jgi:hypothetical protein
VFRSMRMKKHACFHVEVLARSVRLVSPAIVHTICAWLPKREKEFYDLWLYLKEEMGCPIYYRKGSLSG